MAKGGSAIAMWIARSACGAALTAACLGCARESAIDANAAARVEAAGPGVPRGPVLAPVVLDADLRALDESERALVPHLVEAVEAIDTVFEQQQGGAELDARGQAAAAAHAHAPDGHAIAIPARSALAFYPPGFTREEFGRFLARRPDRAAELIAMTSIVVRRGDDLVGVPFSDAYSDSLGKAASSLRRAQAKTRHEGFARCLEALARALENDRYREAENLCARSGSVFVLTLGPFSTDADTLFGHKAAFEGFLGVIDAHETDRARAQGAAMRETARRLAIEDAPLPGAGLLVVDAIAAGGAARVGIVPIAFTLPHDAELRRTRGPQRVLAQNVARAKFRTVLAPIARRALASSDIAYLDERAFFDLVVLHEAAHDLAFVETAAGASISERLGQNALPIEEARAGLVGALSALTLARENRLRGIAPASVAATYAVGLVRGMRFGPREAHGIAAAIEFNMLRESQALALDPASARVRVDLPRLEDALASAARVLRDVQAAADHDEAAAIVSRYGALGPDLEDALAALADLPLDIDARFEAQSNSASTSEDAR